MVDLFIRVIANVPPETVLQWLATAGVLGVVLQKIKHWLEIQSSGVLNVLNYVLAVIAFLIQGIVTASANDPTLIPQQAAGLFALTIGLYHTPFIGIKALSGLMQEVKDRKEQKARIAEKSILAEEDPVVFPALSSLESVAPQLVTVSADAPVAITPAVPEEFAA